MKGPTVDATRERALRDQAAAGVAAMIELLGGDPNSPRFRDSAQGLLSVLEARVGQGERSPDAMAGLVEQVLEMPAASSREVLLEAVPWSGLCETHVVPAAGVVTIAYDCGDAGVALTPEQLQWLVSLHGTGLTNPLRIAMRLAMVCRERFAAAGTLVDVSFTSCPGDHDEASALSGATIAKGTICDERIRDQFERLTVRSSPRTA